jgi:hypothetical protein
MTAAKQDYENGKISEAEMAARIRAAGEALTTADAGTGREENLALASKAQQRPAIVAAQTSTPPSEPENSCFLISCGPATREAVATPAQEKPPAEPAAANTAIAKPPAPPQPAEDHDSCFLIPCE